MPHKTNNEGDAARDQTQEPEEIGKAHLDGTELARDKQRQNGGPRYGGGPWEVAEERGDKRFGHARNDDADPSEVTTGKQEADGDDEWPGHDASSQTGAIGDDEEATERAAATDDGSTETGGQREGMGHGEKRGKAAARAKGRQ